QVRHFPGTKHAPCAKDEGRRGCLQVESGMRNEIDVDDVVGALCRLRPHGGRSLGAFESEPCKPAHLSPPGAVITPAGIIVPAVVAFAISVTRFVDYRSG